MTKPKKVKLSVYLQTYFEKGSAPTRNTVISWIQKGLLVGEQVGQPGKNGKRGGPWYVYPEAEPHKNQPVAELIAEFSQEALNYEYGRTS